MILTIQRNPQITKIITKSLYLCTAKKPDQPQQPKPQLTPQDFSQIDIRVGQIVQCWKHPQSQNLYCQKIKIVSNPQTITQVASGLRKYVELQKMKGKVMVMANLKSRKMVGFQSQGMLVCATSADKTQCQIIVPDGQVGSRIFLQGYQDLFPQSGKVLSILNPKKKILERCLEDFKTDGQGYVVWKGIRLLTKNGPLKTGLKNALVY